MSRRHVRWLLNELPNLTRAGVLPVEIEDQIRQHYGDVGRESGRRAVMVFCGILGGLLVGGGITLLLAHNWEELSRGARTAVALAPLLVLQGLGGWVALRRSESLTWREGVGLLWTLMVGTAVALVAQTYHIPGDLGSFLLTCSLLSLPIVYLLDAATPAALYLVAVAFWAGYARQTESSDLWFWPLVGLAVPYLWRVRRLRHRYWQVFLDWVLAVSLALGAGFTLHDALPEAWILVYGALFPLLFLLGEGVLARTPVWSSAGSKAGALGIFGFALVLTYHDVWDEVVGPDWFRVDSVESVLAVSITTVLVLASLAALVWELRGGIGGELRVLAMASLTVFAAVAWGLFLMGLGALVPTALFNLYVLALGGVYLVDGMRLGSLLRANGGLAIVAVLVVSRFFDSDLSFLLRGVLFIAVGIGFLVTNVVLLRRKDRGSP